VRNETRAMTFVMVRFCRPSAHSIHRPSLFPTPHITNKATTASYHPSTTQISHRQCLSLSTMTRGSHRRHVEPPPTICPSPPLRDVGSTTCHTRLSFPKECGWACNSPLSSNPRRTPNRSCPITNRAQPRHIRRCTSANNPIPPHRMTSRHKSPNAHILNDTRRWKTERRYGTIHDTTKTNHNRSRGSFLPSLPLH